MAGGLEWCQSAYVRYIHLKASLLYHPGCNTDSTTDPINGSVAMHYYLISLFLKIAIDCGEPPTVDDGSFNVTETTFQSMARYGCNEGFTLSGSQSRTCQADGTWSGTDPVCVAPGNSSPAIAAGVVVGLVVAALIALGIIVVIILRRRRQRKGGANIVTGSSGNRFEDLSNPIYSGREILYVSHCYFIMQTDEYIHTYIWWQRNHIFMCISVHVFYRRD